MIIPKKLKIGGLNYEVLLKDRWREDGVSQTGTQHQYVQKIWIDSKCHPQQQEEALLHEILEAINCGNELKLEHPQITALGSCLYQVLKDNGLLK